MTQYYSLPPSATVLGPSQHRQHPNQQQQQRRKRLIFFIIVLSGIILVVRQVSTPPQVAKILKDASTTNVRSSSSFSNNSLTNTTNSTTTSFTNSSTPQAPSPSLKQRIPSSMSISDVKQPDPMELTGPQPEKAQQEKEMLPETEPDEEKNKDKDEDESVKDQQEEDKEDQLLQLKDSSQEKDQDQIREVKTEIRKKQSSGLRPPNLLSFYEPISRPLKGDDNLKQKEAIEHLWSRPKVIHYYIRKTPTSSNTNASDLFIYTTGVNMGNFNIRKLSVYGCVIPPFIYPLSSYPTHNMDVFLCHLPFTPNDQINISLAIVKDKYFSSALQSPLPQPLNNVLEYNNDIFNIPSTYQLYNNYITKKAPTTGVASIKQLVHISSNVIINDKSNKVELFEKGNELNIPRFEICGVTMMKQFPYLIPDWIDYHRRLGVDMFYIFDNDSHEDLKRTHSKRNDVDVIYWPYQRSQVQAMSYIAVTSRSRCEWLISFDADEYILLPLGRPTEKNELNPYKDKRPLKHFLNEMRRKDYDDIRFKYITMGPSANTYIPKIPAPEAYVCKWFSQKLNVKSASLTNRNWLISKVHYQKGSFHPKSKLIKGKVDDRPIDFNFTNFDQGPALVHFQFRSLEESMLKKKFGSSSIGDKNPSVAREDNKETRSLLNPTKEYREIIPSLKYTFFRDVWRNVTEAIPSVTSLGRTLVVWKDNYSKRCVMQWMGDDESGYVNDEMGEQCTLEKDRGVGMAEFSKQKLGNL